MDIEALSNRYGAEALVEVRTLLAITAVLTVEQIRSTLKDSVQLLARILATGDPSVCVYCYQEAIRAQAYAYRFLGKTLDIGTRRGLLRIGVTADGETTVRNTSNRGGWTWGAFWH